MNIHPTFSSWHAEAVEKAGPISDKMLYLRVMFFGLALFAGNYIYTLALHLNSPVNKAMATTSVWLIGFSMWLSSLCYFWNFVDRKIVYRKHLGLIGFAFALAHTALSYTALQRLFLLVTWQKGAMWPALSATVALLIFTVMALISNKYAAQELGGIWWRRLLRLGHLGLALVWLHVVLLKGPRWVTWWTDGPKSLPAMSLIVSIFIGVVLVMRVALWWALLQKKRAQITQGEEKSPQ